MDNRLTRGQGTATGTDTYAVDILPKLDAYRTDYFFWIKFTNGNTGAATLNINGLGAKAIEHEGSAIASGDITANEHKLLKYDGTAFQILASSSALPKKIEGESTEQLLSTTTGINGKVVATTNLYTVPTGKTAIIRDVIVTLSAISGGGTVPKVGVGVAAGEDDMFASTSLSGLTATNKLYELSNGGARVKGLAGQIIKLGVDNASTHTTYTMTVDLIGYLK